MNYTLRRWEYEDGPSLMAAANDFLVSRYLRDSFPHPYTEKNALSYIAYCKNTPDSLDCIRAIDVDGQAVGSISLRFGSDVYQKNAELGYWLAVPFWGKGIMTSAVAEMVRTGFEEYDLHRIFAEVYSPNGASARVLEKNGFRREGNLREAVYKNEQYMDLFVYSLLRHH